MLGILLGWNDLHGFNLSNMLLATAMQQKRMRLQGDIHMKKNEELLISILFMVLGTSLYLSKSTNQY